MKLSTLFCAVVSLLFSLQAPAALMVRDGGLIYDSDTDLTWTTNAHVSGSGKNWSEAMSWADGLIYAGFDDWRLPSAVGINSGALCRSVYVDDPVAPCVSEMGSLFLQLGGFRGATLVDLGLDDGDPIHNVGVQYWLQDAHDADEAYMFWFQTGGGGDSGLQGFIHKGQHHYAWAVREGDVAATAVHSSPAWSLLLLGMVTGLRFRQRR